MIDRTADRRFPGAYVLFAVFAMACGQVAYENETQSALVTGNNTTPAADQADAFTGVVRVKFGNADPSNPGVLCTGQLIDCRHVLTAQHCLNSATHTHAHIGFLRHSPAHKYKTVSVPIQVGTTVFQRVPGVYQGVAKENDMLAIRLPQAAPRGFRRLKYYDGPIATPPGTTAAVVGYGKIANGQFDPDEERRHGTIFKENLSYSNQMYWWIPGSAAETGGIEGDSGGPLLFDVNGTWRTAGVLSLFSATVPPISNEWAVIANHRTWLDGITGTPENDDDGDEQPDSCDNCPESNAEQVDSDNDGLGDVCDWCTDKDGDGVCNQNDNCVGVPNSLQENCNLDAELDREAAEMGDACDPVPCPRFTAPVHTQVVITSTINQCTYYAETRDLRSIVRPAPIGSHNPVSGAELGTSSPVETRFRFCQKDPANFRNCEIQTDQRRDEQFTEDFIPGNPLSGYFPASMLGVTNSSTPSHYPQAEVALTWDYWTDRAAWISSGWMSTPLGSAQKPAGANDLTYVGSVSGLDGFFGLRGEWLDLRGTSSNPSNGIHPSPVWEGQAEGAGLARHYEEMKPDAFVTFGPVNKCLASCPPPCFNMDLTAVLRWCPHCTKRPVGWMYPSQPWDFMLAKNAAGNWGFAMPSGTMQDVSSFVDAEVLYRLNDSGLRFVAASEPFAAQGAPQAAAQAVFALADGRGIHAGVFANEGFFAYDRSLELTSGISARMGAAFVYSRALATLFVIGGEAGGNLTREIWMHRIGVGTELLDTSEYRPEYVWAAQAASDGTLWVLDSPTQAANTRRLSRIHVPSGAAHVVWSGVRDGSFTEYVLRADREGSMLLFSANASDYCTLRWRAQSYELGTELPVLMRNDTGTLRGPPSVHPAGYQFLLESGRDNFMRQDVAELVDQFGGSPPVSRCL